MTKQFPDFACMCMLLSTASIVMAKSVTMRVVVRDHVKQASSTVQISGAMWDSTSGSWKGTRPSQGVEGLPAPQTSYGWGERYPLSPTVATVGWPGRVVVRLDYMLDDTSSRQQCSGSLVGPRHVLTAAHCVNETNVVGSIDDAWVTDNFVVRPGYNLGKSLSGFDRVPVVKSWVALSKFNPVDPRTIPPPRDDDWAILELDRDVGTEIGWARVVPINYLKSTQNIHLLGYPQIPPACATGSACDRSSKTDTLCHSWSELSTDYSSPGGWLYYARVWQGQSGSGALQCPDKFCDSGKVDVVGTIWRDASISSIDSVTSGIISAILKDDVKLPPASVVQIARPEFDLRLDGVFLQASTDRDGEWQILSLDGRVIGVPSFGRNLSIAADRLPRGVALVVFRAPGQAPVTRRWVGR